MNNTPTLCEWLGGIEALNGLSVRFYDRVRDDAILAPVFAHMEANIRNTWPPSSPKCSVDRRTTQRATADIRT